MRCTCVLLFITILGGTWRLGRPTCVLESDFGFSINCAFKKSGLFRVRNLGGVKAHIGLGFSLGDELGFKESLTNVENSKRRSVSASKFTAQLIQAQQEAAKKENTFVPKMTQADARMGPADVVTPSSLGAASKKSSIAVPPFKPIPPSDDRYVAKQPPSIVSGKLPSPELMAVIAVPKKDMNVRAQDKNINDNFAVKILQGTGASNNEVISQLSLPDNNSLIEDDFDMVTHRPLPLPPMRIKPISTTPRYSNKYANSVGKVMNAPKEYYPVGYDKNFDDNFASRVELPETSFYCGDQKHFPGLYADEDLGCMVFHVCALTDDGLIMKSFLCPESTLFDQTILKCNWWFYVDCKNSKKLYDSNIPISKSYQLMKALTFFSTYNNVNRNSSKTNDKD
ncbi:uncharacterized protein LOC130896068 isoform X1 [Diorhabda carinulata]|uniref:uncharacterized protein LOC130896068 isoform X1 n=1 Tax=Diorhabda carinulata TaxID=1163345 RepID=UPI0025A11E33|nr:uncharacterized protein LOC130896068 isoform X1 [Diorhabda carinulata]